MIDMKHITDMVRNMLIGPPRPEKGNRLTPEVRASFEKVDQQATVLHELARAMQRPDERRYTK